VLFIEFESVENGKVVVLLFLVTLVDAMDEL
jgi:hypothetical protein